MKHETLYGAYETDELELPVAIEESVAKLAKTLGIRESSVYRLINGDCETSKMNKFGRELKVEIVEFGKKVEVKKVKIDPRKLEIEMARKMINNKGLAELAGVTKPTITHIRKGKPCLPITAGKLAIALGVDVATLLEG